MENRKCKVCGEVKPITEYYKHGKYYDTKCKECAKAYSRKYASEHAEELKAYRQQYYQDHKSESIARSKEWTESNRDKHNAYCRKWNAEHRQDRREYLRRYRAERHDVERAHYFINSRVQRGKITKPNACEVCGKVGRVEAHHEDYTKPLDVIWCCKECHWTLDEARRGGKRG